MKLSGWMALGVLILGTSVALGQSIEDQEKVLHDALVKQQRVMRGFSAEKTSYWRWDGKALVEQLPPLRIVAVLNIKSIKFSGDQLEISGDRRGLQLDKDGKTVVSHEGDKVKIQVDLRGANLVELIPQLEGLLFYPDVASSLPDMPQGGRSLRELPSHAVVKKSLVNCDCAQLDGNGCKSKSSELGMTGMTPPSLLSSVEPEFSDEARGRKFSGDVQVYMTVNQHGLPGDLWIMKAVGMGLDQKAAEAVSQYRFKPAACHGQPVKVDLYIDVNFKIF